MKQFNNNSKYLWSKTQWGKERERRNALWIRLKAAHPKILLMRDIFTFSTLKHLRYLFWNGKSWISWSDTISALILRAPLCFDWSHTHCIVRRTIQNDTNHNSKCLYFPTKCDWKATTSVIAAGKTILVAGPKNLYLRARKAGVNDDWHGRSWNPFYGETAPIDHWPGWDKFERVADLRDR